MRAKIIFFALMLSIGAISCDEEKENVMLGEWSVTWRTGDELLYGEIEFLPGEARLRAFGNTGSSLLESYSTVNYRWNLSADKLVLEPVDNHIRLEYTILERSENRLLLQYLDDIQVSVERF